VARHIRRTFGVFLAVFVFAGAVGVLTIVTTGRILDDVTLRWGPLWGINEQVDLDIVELDGDLRAFLRTGRDEFLLAYRSEAEAVRRDLAFARSIANAEISEGLETQEAIFAEWVESHGDPLVAAAGRGDQAEVSAIRAGGRGPELLAEFELVNDGTEVVILSTMTDGVDQVDRLRRLAGVALVAGLGVGLAAAIVAHRRVKRDLTQPLEDVQDTLRRIEAGDPDARLEPRGVDEVRRVIRALNSTSEENARLAEEQRSALARTQRVAMASRLIRSSLDLTEVLNAAAEAIGTTLGVDRVQVRAIDDVNNDAGGGSWSAPGTPPLVSTAPLTLLTRPAFLALRSGDVVEVASTAVDQVSPEGREWMEAEGIVRAAVAPVLVGTQIVAVVGMHWLDEERRLSETDRSSVEAVCRELGVALGHSRLYESERALVVKLRDLDEAKSDFVSTVSHELRTPLTSIVGNIEMLREGDVGHLDPDQDRLLGAVARNTKRLLTLIEDLLTLSRIESGRFEMEVAEVDPAAAVRSALATLSPRLGEKGLELIADVDDGVPPIMGDAVHIERVVLNLVGNAVKFTPQGGTVNVRLWRRDATTVELSVADTGIGIPEQEQDRLFSRFFRSSIAQAEAIPGTGLGLVIVKSIVEAHDGSVSVTSHAGEGSTFVVRLPVADRTAMAGADRARAPNGAHRVGSRGVLATTTGARRPRTTPNGEDS